MTAVVIYAVQRLQYPLRVLFAADADAEVSAAADTSFLLRPKMLVSIRDTGEKNH